MSTPLIPDALALRLLHALDAGDIEALLPDVFETPDDAARWWTTPHPELDGCAPMDVATTPDGAVKVRDLLANVRYGFGS
jgi:uncharacterized protein (DUF2384 family)